MCDLCRTICRLTKMKTGTFKGWAVPDENKNQIVSDDDGFYIWSDGGGDPFLSGICIENVRFCPICGRNLYKFR